MVSFGAIRVDEALSATFAGKLQPISDQWVPEALAISGISRDQHLQYDDPALVMQNFAGWLAANSHGRPVFVSDNPAFDWQFINYYFHRYIKQNPFGFSARRIGDLYCGLVRDISAASAWKKLRVTPHTHDPLDDARGNAEALLALVKQYNLRLPK